MADTRKLGRPSKGDRQVVWSRLAAHRARSVHDLAAERDLAMSDVMDALIAVGLAHLDEAKLPPVREVLPQTA